MKFIIDFLKSNVIRNPDKIIFLEDSEHKITYGEFDNHIDLIATSIVKEKNLNNKPIAIFIDRSIDCLKAMFGILRSGNFYCVIDEKSPLNRINSILETLNPELIISNNKNIDLLNSYNLNIDILNIDLINYNIDYNLLERVTDNFIDSNPAYVLFTSGSTGIPKGTVVSHKSLVSYIDWFVQAFKIDDNTIFGNQTPFYFSMSVSDIFATAMVGSTFCIIPKLYFSFPTKLIEYMNNNMINTIYWVPSALNIVANLKTFEYVKPEYLKMVLFAGEVMPMPQLNIWRESLPNLIYANLFGPSETTDIFAYYIINRTFNNTETLPIGKNCENSEIILVNDELKECQKGEIGEMYVKGTIVCNGYYNNIEKTKEVFVQNPLNQNYYEIVYKTGDLAKYNDYGELEYCGRKDFQIKHMGYRIELGEIEANINALNEVTMCACIYSKTSSKIVLYFESDTLNEEDIIKLCSERLVGYMRPNKIIKLNKLPYNANGKIDRIKLQNIFEEMEK